jgi:hypothetical protein
MQSRVYQRSLTACHRRDSTLAQPRTNQRQVAKGLATYICASAAWLLAIVLPIDVLCAEAISSTHLGSVARAYSDNSRMNWDRTGPRPLATAIWYSTDESNNTPVSVTAPSNPMLFALPPMIDGAPLALLA